MTAVLILQLPSPPRKNVFRDWSGGMGTALDSARSTMGHDAGFYEVPYAAHLYTARRLEEIKIPFAYVDLQAKASLAADDFDAVIAQHRPSILVAQVNLPSLAHDLELVARARNALPGLKVIFVGATAKWFRNRMLQDGNADIVMEEAEEFLVAENIAAFLANDTSRLQGCSVLADGKVTHRPARATMKDLNFIDFPAYELLDFSKYESAYYGGRRVRYATVFTSKGCPYTCGYCPYPFGFGARLVYRSPERIGADIERLVRQFGVQQILFRDQVFTINPRHARAVCEELIRRDLGISWVCETRYDLVTPDLLALMKRAGCIEVHYGLELADPTLFATIAKTDGPQSLELFEQAIGWARAEGLTVHVHLIVGLPDESAVSIGNTTKWLRRVKPDSVQIAYFVPYPGTPLFKELRDSRELGDVERIEWEKLGAFSDPVLPTRHLTIPQVRRARQDLASGWRYSLADRVVNRVKRLAGLAVR